MRPSGATGNCSQPSATTSLQLVNENFELDAPRVLATIVWRTKPTPSCWSVSTDHPTRFSDLVRANILMFLRRVRKSCVGQGQVALTALRANQSVDPVN